MSKSLNDVRLAPGRYIAAISGGVDSMSMLDLLASQPGVELVVAHFNHGIRTDSSKDERLVKKAAKARELAFETVYGGLGPKTSEDQARRARYAFLEEVRQKYGARAIITAHHQDDLIETAIINILRGSGRKGLSAIKDNPKVIRPLIDVPKTDLLGYAVAHRLEWNEDATNSDPKYLRNYLRLQIMPKLSRGQRVELLENIDKVAKNRLELEELIATLSRNIINKGTVDRSKFAVLPIELSGELMAFWLKQQGLTQFDRKTVERLFLGLKTARPNTEVIAGKNLKLVVGTTGAHFSNR